ncbi:MAG: DUF3891 family protein [Ardenticatenaceae bacterium]|nr:DUF3891 family protein [Ardenticatenaceae bacterium]
MFKSRARPVNVPQYEHGRLAGIFASFWGNGQFDKPDLDEIGFINGVVLHDWHYGPIDNLPIAEGNETEWLKMVRRGVDLWFDDPIVDIVAKLHLRRLLSGRKRSMIETLIGEIDARIAERLPQTGFTREQFEWADKITRFCDNVAFDFSFEREVERSYALYAQIDSREETAVTYTIGPEGAIGVDPWPFGVSSFSGVIIGYERPGYPDQLRPVVIPYHCRPAS